MGGRIASCDSAMCRLREKASAAVPECLPLTVEPSDGDHGPYGSWSAVPPVSKVRRAALK
ncbi:hypothetical protein GCM10023107_70480 [Actinoplanes octamycinicus]|nr:hypothetical protein Aoc01nite_27370 [Actinoplanes octamycinicus]